MDAIKKIEQDIKEGFRAAPGSVAAIMNEAKHAVLNDEPTKLGENDQPVVSSSAAGLRLPQQT